MSAATSELKDHVYMYIFSNKGSGPSPTVSHFCAKLQVWLDLAGVPYSLINQETPAGPYNKLPYIKLNGEEYGDSSIIIDTLSHKLNKNLDKTLDEKQKAAGLAVKRMIEEHTFFLLVDDRWSNHPDLFSEYLGTVQSYPSLMRPIVKMVARRRLLGATYSQGVGRLPDEEKKKRLSQDVSSLASILGNKSYMLTNDEPTEIDATVFGFMLAELGIDPEYTKVSAFCQECQKYDNLMSYYERMSDKIKISK
ncbi:hypothetical protein FOL47_010802 [Perkinsus chesapeaki]|uniref:Chloride intracellular channel protein 4 n=1 Tax=Perkinsus chesapeaki TaxID=330153 RepID=A0A7J6KZY1_PERCH|nr:hypothetical protein FOL47_010802 [Perkinsus chesapeaki]